MEVTISITADYYEELESVKTFLSAHDYLAVIEEAQGEVRNRLKHDDITDEEAEFLCSLQDTLWIKE